MVIQEPANSQPLQSINSSLMPSAPFVQSQVFSSPQIDQGFIEKEEKPKIFTVISVLLFLIALFYGFSTAIITGILLVVSRVASNSGLPDFYLLKYFPLIGLIPLLTLLATMLFLVSAIKIRDGSKFSWWTGVISLIAIPIPLDLAIFGILSNLYKSSQFINGTQNEGIARVPFNIQTLSQYIYVFAIFELALLPLLIFFKKFNFKSQSLSERAKVFLVIISCVFVLPVLTIVGYGYYKTTDVDYGYSKVKSEVGYHVYKPQTIPSGRTNGTIFIPKRELAGLQNAIQVAYDIPLDEIIKGKASSLIVMKQVGVTERFDLTGFVRDIFKDQVSIVQIPLSLANQGSAYLIQRTSGKLELKILAFVTPDHVLIEIVTPNAPKEDLVQFAESLR